jgi:hypothetical protein
MLTKQQMDELYELAKPIVRWCRDNTNPHMDVQINMTGLQVREDVSGLLYNEFEPEHFT